MFVVNTNLNKEINFFYYYCSRLIIIARHHARGRKYHLRFLNVNTLFHVMLAQLEKERDQWYFQFSWQRNCKNFSSLTSSFFPVTAKFLSVKMKHFFGRGKKVFFQHKYVNHSKNIVKRTRFYFASFCYLNATI